MPIWVYLIFGWLMGSFCGAYAYRWPRNISMLKPLRSTCPNCGATIPFYHNIPIISFLMLKGRSRCCGQKMAVDYLIIEVASFVLYPLIIYPVRHMNLLHQLQWTIFFYLLFTQTFIDIRHRLIPDTISLGGTIAGLAFSFAYYPHHIDFLIQRGAGAIVGFLFFWLIAFVYQKIARREGLGMGDMKLMMMIGAFLSITHIFSVVLLSSLIGLTIGLITMAKDKGSFQTAIPFGPAIAAGAALVYLAIFYQIHIPFIHI